MSRGNSMGNAPDATTDKLTGEPRQPAHWWHLV